MPDSYEDGEPENYEQDQSLLNEQRPDWKHSFVVRGMKEARWISNLATVSLDLVIARTPGYQPAPAVSKGESSASSQVGLSVKTRSVQSRNASGQETEPE